MPEKKINDTRMIRLVNEGVGQAEIAREFGVSPAAVNKRLKQLRGKTTHAVVADKIEGVIGTTLDTWSQLKKINKRANELLDQAGDNVQDCAPMMREIREQLKLQADLFKILFDVRAAMEFQDTVLSVIGKIDPEVRRQILQELNSKSVIRNAVSFR